MNIDAPSRASRTSQDAASADDRQGAVRQIEIPPAAKRLSTLDRIDYTDCFLLAVPSVRERTAEQWARAVIEGASRSTRTGLRRGWFALGVRLEPAEDPAAVLGWPIRRSTPDVALLAARSSFGMQAEILIKREGGAVLLATLMKLGNPLIRLFWSGFAFQHRRVLRSLLEACGRRAGR